jgi:hypothetical protein
MDLPINPGGPPSDYKWGHKSLSYGYRCNNRENNRIGNGYGHGRAGEPRSGVFAQTERARWALFNDASTYRIPRYYPPPYGSTVDGQWHMKWAHQEGGNAVTHSGDAHLVPNHITGYSWSAFRFTWPTGHNTQNYGVLDARLEEAVGG